jgi:transcriptional regulator with XRE-family HTH domain
MALIGSRLRELRLKRNLTLAQVAEDTGFVVSYLSQLERDKVSISVDNLERLARYYEVHMVHFFRGPQESPVFVTRREQMMKNLAAQTHGPAVVTLIANRAEARLEPLLIKINPGQEEPHFRQHEADALIYILEGHARLISDNGEETELFTGDLAYYVNYPHRRVANASQDRPLLILAITAPPTSALDGLVDTSQAT